MLKASFFRSSDDKNNVTCKLKSAIKNSEVDIHEGQSVLFFNFIPLNFNILIIRDVAQSGSALRSGRRGRWFESSHPDKFLRLL